MLERITDRERVLIKLAIASTLDALTEVVNRSHTSMLMYRARNPDKLLTGERHYYDTHRQFEELGYELADAVNHRMQYDDDMSFEVIIK